MTAIVMFTATSGKKSGFPSDSSEADMHPKNYEHTYLEPGLKGCLPSHRTMIEW